MNETPLRNKQDDSSNTQLLLINDYRYTRYTLLVSILHFKLISQTELIEYHCLHIKE